MWTEVRERCSFKKEKEKCKPGEYGHWKKELVRNVSRGQGKRQNTEIKFSRMHRWPSKGPVESKRSELSGCYFSQMSPFWSRLCGSFVYNFPNVSVPISWNPWHKRWWASLNLLPYELYVSGKFLQDPYSACRETALWIIDAEKKNPFPNVLFSSFSSCL